LLTLCKIYSSNKHFKSLAISNKFPAAVEETQQTLDQWFSNGCHFAKGGIFNSLNNGHIEIHGNLLEDPAVMNKVSD